MRQVTLELLEVVALLCLRGHKRLSSFDLLGKLVRAPSLQVSRHCTHNAREQTKAVQALLDLSGHSAIVRVRAIFLAHPHVVLLETLKTLYDATLARLILAIEVFLVG